MTLRLRILQYIKDNEDADFFQMSKDLDLRLDILAMELKILKDKECVTVYKGGFYSLTSEGERVCYHGTFGTSLKYTSAGVK